MAIEGKKARGFGQLIGPRVLDAVGDEAALGAPGQPRRELAQRGDAIAKMASDIVYSQNEWVDPALCRPSSVNARD